MLEFVYFYEGLLAIVQENKKSVLKFVYFYEQAQQAHRNWNQRHSKWSGHNQTVSEKVAQTLQKRRFKAVLKIEKTFIIANL